MARIYVAYWSFSSSFSCTFLHPFPFLALFARRGCAVLSANKELCCCCLNSDSRPSIDSIHDGTRRCCSVLDSICLFVNYTRSGRSVRGGIRNVWLANCWGSSRYHRFMYQTASNLEMKRFPTWTSSMEWKSSLWLASGFGFCSFRCST